MPPVSQSVTNIPPCALLINCSCWFLSEVRTCCQCPATANAGGISLTSPCAIIFTGFAFQSFSWAYPVFVGILGFYRHPGVTTPTPTLTNPGVPQMACGKPTDILADQDEIHKSPRSAMKPTHHLVLRCNAQVPKQPQNTLQFSYVDEPLCFMFSRVQAFLCQKLHI